MKIHVQFQKSKQKIKKIQKHKFRNYATCTLPNVMFLDQLIGSHSTKRRFGSQ